MAFGDPSSGGDKTRTAEGLLTQIKGLLHQYLDLGDSTPLADQAHNFLGQVEDGIDQLKGEAESPSEDTAEGGEPSESGTSSPPDFRSARKAAGDAMRNGTLGGMHDGAKTHEEQPPDEEDKKKRSKAY